MSDDGDEEIGGLRVGPYVPDSGLQPNDGSPANAVTEYIPAVVIPEFPASTAEASAVEVMDGLFRAPQPRSTEDEPVVSDVWLAGEPVSPAAPAPPVRLSFPQAPDAEGPGEPSLARDLSVPIRASLANAQTDEWLPVPRYGAQSPPVGAVSHEPAVAVPGTALVPRRVALPAVRVPKRRGPVLIDADNWDFLPDEKNVTNETYAGRRRAGKRSSRVLLAVGVLLVGAATVTGVEWVMRSAETSPRTASPTVGAGLPSYPGDEGQVVPATTAPAGPTTGALPGQSGSPSASASASRLPFGNPSVPASASPDPTGSVAPSPTAPPTSDPPAFTPLTVEAETAGSTLSGSAARTTFAGTSGGQMVGYLGNVGEGTPGVLTLTGISVPTTGTYLLTISYVANSNRTAFIAVNADAAQSVVANATGGCCGTLQVSVTLQAGTNTITFSNPSARCPAIDRVVISLP